MKKFYLILAAGLFLLGGCLPYSNAMVKKSSSVSKSGSKDQSKSRSNSGSSSSASSESEQEIVTKKYTAVIGGANEIASLTYQGDKILELHIEIMMDFPSTSSETVSNKTPEELANLIRENLQKDADYVAANDVEGFSIEYSVTEDKKLKMIYDLNLQKLDPSQLSSNKYFGQLGIKELKDSSPSKMIGYLEELGFKEVK